MGPDLWELFEYGKEDDEVAAIIRLAHHSALPKGVRVVTQFGEIVTVRLRRGDLLTVSGASEVVSMAAGDTYHGPDVELEMDAELSSDTVLPTDERRAKDSSANGKGVVVGVVDWGFDFAHPDFRKEDGTSRIVALWDQRGGKQPNSPQPFGYGVVHDREAINKSLREKDPYKVLAYHPADADTGIGSHGSHVASIAAGTGGPDRPGGIAYEADLVLVHNAPWDELESGKLGDSVTLLEAIDYISRAAGDRPWVINLSMGRHGEQHDGSTLIEQGLDAALRASPGRAVCMSAGNYFNKRVHASGQLRPTQERTFIWQINEGHPSDYNQLEIWYSWQDRFECSVRSPDGSITATLKVGERAKLKVGGKEVGNVYHRAQEPNNLDNHITIYLYKEAPPGDWEVMIIGSDVIDGRFHAWIEREVACPKCQSHFRAEDADPHTTTGTICNGRRSIAVGAYNAHDAEMRLGPFSSVGPTRDGRLKPDLCAPGVSVLAARSAPREGPAGLLTRMSGTSMAAPHVTGTVALMFQAAPRRLRIEETHNLLLQNAKHVSIPEDIPDRIGIGFLDVDEAVEAARNVARGTPAFKEIVPISAPREAKTVAAGKESSEQDVEVETESQEGFPSKELIEAAVLQAASDMQSAQSEASEIEMAEYATAPASERASIHGVESIPDERVRVGTGGFEGESIGIAAESVRHPTVKSETESIPEIESIGIPSERAPRASAGITEAEMEAGSSQAVATMELEVAEQESESLVEVADQIVRQDSGRLSAVELLRAMLAKTACSPWTQSGERLPSAAEIFDAFVYWRSDGPREQLERCFDVVGPPGSVLQQELRRSDVLVRRGDGDMGHIAIIASPQLKTLETILAEGLIPETISAGLYAQVIETGTWPHELADKFARLITEPNGKIPHRQLILRPRVTSPMRQKPQPMPSVRNGGGRTPEAERILQAAAGMDAEGIGRVIDDLLLLRLATPPPTVVTVAPPASAASAQTGLVTTGSDASEAAYAEDVEVSAPPKPRLPQASSGAKSSAPAPTPSPQTSGTSLPLDVKLVGEFFVYKAVSRANVGWAPDGPPILSRSFNPVRVSTGEWFIPRLGIPIASLPERSILEIRASNVIDPKSIKSQAVFWQLSRDDGTKLDPLGPQPGLVPSSPFIISPSGDSPVLGPLQGTILTPSDPNTIATIQATSQIQGASSVLQVQGGLSLDPGGPAKLLEKFVEHLPVVGPVVQLIGVAAPATAQVATQKTPQPPIYSVTFTVDLCRSSAAIKVPDISYNVRFEPPIPDLTYLVAFANDQSIITSAETTKLLTWVQEKGIGLYPGLRQAIRAGKVPVVITGKASVRGHEHHADHNFSLSQRRVEAVRRVLQGAESAAKGGRTEGGALGSENVIIEAEADGDFHDPQPANKDQDRVVQIFVDGTAATAAVRTATLASSETSKLLTWVQTTIGGFPHLREAIRSGQVPVLITGQTVIRGDPASNFSLSQRQVEAVRNALQGPASPSRGGRTRGGMLGSENVRIDAEADGDFRDAKAANGDRGRVVQIFIDGKAATDALQKLNK